VTWFTLALQVQTMCLLYKCGEGWLKLQENWSYLQCLIFVLLQIRSLELPESDDEDVTEEDAEWAYLQDCGRVRHKLYTGRYPCDWWWKHFKPAQGRTCQIPSLKTGARTLIATSCDLLFCFASTNSSSLCFIVKNALLLMLS